MFKKLLAFFLLVLIFSSLASSVFATGKECTFEGVGACPAGEQCCCCQEDKECPADPDPDLPKGRCFARTIYTGSSTLDPTTGRYNTVSISVSCADVVCPFSQHTDIKDFIDEAVNYAFYISIILVPLMVVLGGFLILVSTGNPRQAKTGREIIQWSVIGFAITLFAKSISSIVKLILVG